MNNDELPPLPIWVLVMMTLSVVVVLIGMAYLVSRILAA